VTDTGLRILFAITLYTKDFVCEIVDVEAAFLEADMDEQIYIEWPEGVAEFGYETDETIHRDCILLDKAMYGTVQAARQWFKKPSSSTFEVRSSTLGNSILLIPLEWCSFTGWAALIATSLARTDQ
jgi:hypothetical protein